MKYRGQSLQLWIHYYSLKRKTKSNAVTSSPEQRGALIKIQNDFGDEGYADLCPWVNFGDHTLEEELAQQGPLFGRALDLALEDLAARKNKVSLLSEKPIKNNILINDFRTIRDFDFSKYTVKIKGNEHIADLAKFLTDNVNLFGSVRLDFNNCLSEFSFNEFLNLLSEKALNKIEYVEDPFFFHRDDWAIAQAKVPLALDWRQAEDQDWSFRIWKPSREAKMACHRFSITSAMEHPVGLVHALRFAQLYPDKTHGFLTLDQYEQTDFHSAFKVENDLLTYSCDGYGIGFTTLLRKINWIPVFDEDCFLLSNHRASENEKLNLFTLKRKFQESQSAEGLVLIPSSGSTQKLNETTKVMVHTQQSLLNSALRINKEFNVHENSVWGCLLPLFHVGGLGIFIRAQISGGRICFADWSEFSPDWVSKNKITHLSLVPTQVYEIVQKNWKAPAFLQAVFVGGAELSPELAVVAKDLGWPIVQTFGMTETASMIAIKSEGEFFQTLPNVEIASENGYLKIKSDSNAEAILQLDVDSKKLHIEKLGLWITSRDQVEIVGQKFKFLQRESDFIKIKGEGVSLSELRAKLGRLDQATICDLPDPRDGVKLVLVVKRGVDAKAILDKYNQHVRPFEKISSYVEVEEFPMTELGKIKYNVLKEVIHAEKSKS